MTDIRVGIIGDFDPGNHTHTATNDSISHAAQHLSLSVEVEWLETEFLDDEAGESKLKQFDALWASAGSPYKSMDGMLRGIRFARESNWPFVAT